MDDWDAFDPDLHAALNASLTPPAADEQMQSTDIMFSGGSEVTVQSAQQVHTARGTGSSAQQGYVTASTLRQEQLATGGPTGPSTSRAQFHAALYSDSVQTGTTQTTFPSVQAAPTLGQQQTHAPAQRVPSPPSGNVDGTVDSTGGSELSFAPHGAGGSSSGPNGGGSTPPFPSFQAGSQNQQRQGQAFTI